MIGWKERILMSSKPLKNTLQRDKLYKIADRIWSVAAWIWSAIIIVFLVSFAAGLAIAEPTDQAIFNRVLRWLSNPQSGKFLLIPVDFFRITILTLLILFIAITLLSVFLRQILKPPTSKNKIDELLEQEAIVTKEQEAIQIANKKEGFRHYLHSVKELSQNISPNGLAQYSRTLLFSDVPLEEVFVHLQLIPDRPIFDIPFEQERQRVKLQEHTDLSEADRENYFRRLRVTWYSQLRQDYVQEQHQISIEKVLESFSPENPVAIILGSPGSGKTTFLRWVAYHLADTLLSSDLSSLAHESPPSRIPILIQTNDYAEWLAKDSGTLRQYLIIQLSETHPNAYAKVLDALDHGHCLVLFDGLDEGLSHIVRRHVINSIYAFILDHAVVDQQMHQANNFIITSRIADYNSELFARYSHYSLLDLDEQHIGMFLSKWYTAIGRNTIHFNQGTQLPAMNRIVEVRRSEQEYLHAMLTTHPVLKEFAANPLILTLMVFMQINGQDVFQHRFDLYQVVTRTLLDTWNRESGRKMFSEEEISLVEDVLARFAYHLQNDDVLLSIFDTEIITRQAMADVYRLQLYEIKLHTIKQLVETLRRSSGLFAEVGEGLFCFPNQAFQDYYAALYLLNKSREERRELVARCFTSNKWSEPILLMLMCKRAHNSRDERGEINEILETILDRTESNAPEQQNLLFVISCIVNGRLLVTNKTLRSRIRDSAEHLVQQQSADLSAEQRDLLVTFLQVISRQTLNDEIPTQPLKRT
jgi:hypothetical protein